MNDLEMMFSPRGPSTPKRRRMAHVGYTATGSASKTSGPRFSTPVRKQGPAPSPSALLAGMGSNLFPGRAVGARQSTAVLTPFGGGIAGESRAATRTYPCTLHTAVYSVNPGNRLVFFWRFKRPPSARACVLHTSTTYNPTRPSNRAWLLAVLCRQGSGTLGVLLCRVCVPSAACCAHVHTTTTTAVPSECCRKNTARSRLC